MKEKIKEWWDRNPCCSINSQKTGTEFFQEIEDIIYSWHPWIRDYFIGCKDKKVLEIGCGMGRDLIQFAMNGAIVTGIDISPNSIRLAEENFKLNNLKTTLLIMDAEDLKFPGESFDMVYSYGVLHHTVNTQKGIDEIFRVLKPNGKAIVMLYNKYSLIRLTHPNINKYEGRNKDEKEYCPIVKVFSTNEARKMFSNFSSIKITKKFVGRLESYLPDFIKERIGWHIIIEGIK